ncbi:unnamed protein product [Cylindrotheca closterium]|uniref:SEC7 domain-containing protein n=1 Tax=Cylindrotheca closterium TaxID=2856 RepID=A0AAD2JN27_9STRA|nr:unnamed protein product [Cylindrotheca closterium]
MDTGMGLFAGLSMSPSKSPEKKPAPPQSDAPPSPPSSQVFDSVGSEDSTPKANSKSKVSLEGGEDAPPAVPISPHSSDAADHGPLQQSPATDKLLGILGGGGNDTRSSVNSASSQNSSSRPGLSKSDAKKKIFVAPNLEKKDGKKHIFVPPELERKNGDRHLAVATEDSEDEADTKEAPKKKPEKPKMDAETLAAFSEDATPLGKKGDNAKQPPASTPSSVVSSSMRGVGVVHPDTPIPNSIVALRLLQKFADKTRPWVSATHGGTQRRPIMAFVFGMPSEYNRRFDAYRELILQIVGEDDNSDEEEEDDIDQDTKANLIIARFCHLISTWGHASAHMAEAEKNSQYQAFCDILAVGLDTATALVSHGCLDGVLIGIGTNQSEYHKAVDFLAESVFASDLSKSRNELSAMKFLLSTGCRVGVNGEAMLRGTHLLQTVRVLYHVYLSTFSSSNKTTARASLQQLVTSVFIRMIASTRSLHNATQTSNQPPPASLTSTDGLHTPHKGGAGIGDDGAFPTQDHRDAFLLLRSLCKLSMRTPPGGKLHSHIGLQASGSNSMWDTSRTGTSDSNGISNSSSSSTKNTPKKKPKVDGKSSDFDKDALRLVSTQAIHPALESKILALQLMLYVLQNTDMKGSFLQQCGPQFHYAIRNYLCASLLKNCTSDNVQVVNLSLRVFVPIIHNFRSILKEEIEAFVTNVFFVILDSPNSPIEHKSLVVTLFDEICSDPTTLAEIFLNYDCDLSAVDLFHRIVNTLSKVARTTEVQDDTVSSTFSLDLSGAEAARMEKIRSANRELRLDAMKALRQVLASLHASITEPMVPEDEVATNLGDKLNAVADKNGSESHKDPSNSNDDDPEKKSLVQIYDSKKKRRAEESEVILRFNQKPSAGISYAAKCGHLDGTDAEEVARWLLQNKDTMEKTMIGEYLGREPEYQEGFSLKVLIAYVNSMDFDGLSFDDAIRFYLSGFRLPGEAQKIDRIMEKFAERYTSQNPDVFPTPDVAFILAFSIIMLNTDLHNPAIKEERRMTKEGFVRNNRGICDGQDLPHELLHGIFDRIKSNPISLKEDDEARERVGGTQSSSASSITTGLPSALSPAVFFTSHYDEMEKTKESNFDKERDQIVRTTEFLLKRRRHGNNEGTKSARKTNRQNTRSHHHVRYVRTVDSGLRDEYVSPMFEVAWGPSLAAFSTAMESANGTLGALFTIASDEELQQAAENAAETIEVCLTGFRFAVCTAGLCGNEVARDAFVLALARFSQLGTGILLEPRHVRCMQTMLGLARSDGELLGSSWEHIFKSLSEINRFHQLFQLLARNDKKSAEAAARRRKKLLARERRHQEREARRAANEASDTLVEEFSDDESTDDEYSIGDDLFSDSELDFSDEMDKKEIDEANARTVYEGISEALIEAIYERSASLSTEGVKEFVLQLCRVSRMEISHYGGQVGSNANQVNLTQVHYRQHHTLLQNSESEGFHHTQPNIYNLQKLVEATHYNMDSRPRLVFADIWTTVSAHLTSTALHSNPAVAMYAVDSFRQLSIQYLRREESGSFEFQRRFLKPLEAVMARSQLATTKELLLKCVERLILMFGNADGNGKGGMLRSGWRPVLTVLGLAGRDQDEDIAKLGFEMLTAQLQPCLAPQKGTGKEKSQPGVLLAERFVDIIDAVLIYVGGPHEEMGLKSIDNLLLLSKFLADDSFALPLIKNRHAVEEESKNDDRGMNLELELWWPILLGISKSVGDERKQLRRKSLSALMEIINTYFVPSEEEVHDDESDDRRLQTLQLIFRGILTPVLEFGDVGPGEAREPEVPTDFDRFITGAKETPKDPDNLGPKHFWLDSTFDQFMDGCIGLCLRSIKVFGEDTLVEEIFAMLNTCLLSDSGCLAVHGLRRLEQFVTSDLKDVTDDTWGTVAHMLRRCLAVRGLPKQPASSSKDDSADGDGGEENPALAYKEAIREFVMEENMLSDRRYIGCHAIFVIGTFLEGERFTPTLSLRWRLFLVTGLGKAIQDWEKAASIISENSAKATTRSTNPPNYLETAFYGRNWMNRFLLHVAAMKEVETTETKAQAAAQALVKDQTQSLVNGFLEKEAFLGHAEKKSSLDLEIFDRLTGLVKDILAGYAQLPDEHLVLMAWLNPVLSLCIHTSNEQIRIAIQKLVKRLHAEHLADDEV